MKSLTCDDASYHGIGKKKRRKKEKLKAIVFIAIKNTNIILTPSGQNQKILWFDVRYV